MADGFDLCGVLRRIRRTADLSQRELASAAGLSVSAVAHVEAGTRDLPSRALARAAELAGLRLTLLDADGREVPGMQPDGARDATRRRLPAHLDTEHTDEVADRWSDRRDRRQPWFTFGLDRAARDRQRARVGTPDDHDVPVAGDSPAERRAQRQEAARRRAAEERDRRRATARDPVDDALTCTCPPECDEVDDGSGPPRHAAACPCGCDSG
ncbi:helix-turn-helix domain-containing protein [Geodermatophilus sp. SYSU D01176]